MTWNESCGISRKTSPLRLATLPISFIEASPHSKTPPLRGRIGRMAGSRELVFAPLPYIAVYRVKDGIVEISRIYHGAQDWP